MSTSSEVPGADQASSAAEKSRAAQELLQVLSGKYRVQALSTVASLGIPDLLASRPWALDELAAKLECDADGLDRLLRFTVGLGYLAFEEPNRFSLTFSGKQLCSDALGPLATFVGSPEQWDPWARLRESLQSKAASTPFEETFGVDLYKYLAAEPEAARRYDLAIDSFTQQEARELSAKFDFAGHECLVDVGGGRGKLLQEVLSHWPELKGVLCDLPHVIERVEKTLSPEFASRVTLERGDFFESLPQGHDLYCLKHVLHNWDDERATALLAACANALRPGGRVLVIEAILTPDNRFDFARVMDLEMGVLTPGRARRKPEFRQMFRAAGLKLESVQAIGSSWLLVGAK